MLFPTGATLDSARAAKPPATIGQGPAKGGKSKSKSIKSKVLSAKGWPPPPSLTLYDRDPPPIQRKHRIVEMNYLVGHNGYLEVSREEESPSHSRERGGENGTILSSPTTDVPTFPSPIEEIPRLAAQRTDAIWDDAELSQDPPACMPPLDSTGLESRKVPITRLLRVVEMVLEDKQCYKAFLGATGKVAQQMLDAIQKLIDHATDAATKRLLLMATMRLSTKSGLYPQCLILRHVQYEDHPVAAGQFGEIRRGTFRGRHVCLKVVKLYQRGRIEHLLKNCAKEAIIWSHLNHPNLMPFYGIYHLDDSYGRVCLVSPWMENGNICDYLKAHPTVYRMPLVHDIIQGLNHLHKEYIVHGDLKGVNILVTSEGRACLADFGLSSVMDADVLRWTSLETMTKTGGTARWIAPELMEEDEDGVLLPQPNCASDVYSVGLVMYEVLTGKTPFYEYSRDVTVISKVLRGERPSRPPVEIAPELTDDIWDVIELCWVHKSKERPSVQTIAQMLPPQATFSRGARDRKRSASLLDALTFRSTMYGAEDADVASASDMEVFVRLLYV